MSAALACSVLFDKIWFSFDELLQGCWKRWDNPGFTEGHWSPEKRSIKITGTGWNSEKEK